MAIVDESAENFIVNVPFVEEVDAKLRDEERRRTGRYLAVTAVLLIIGIGLYHTVPKLTSKITALVCAPVILILYLLWLWYASQKRKHQLKRVDLNVESQAKAVLKNLNNVKMGPQENCLYSNSEDETPVKLTNEKVKNYLEKHSNNNNNNDCETSQEHPGNCEILIRTYSIA